MRKLAVFVEGMTEQEFAVALVTALVGKRGVHFALGRQWKGKVQITPTAPPAGVDFYVLIVDCANDEQVKTQIRDQYSTLLASGYTAIIGLRDVYPLARADIPRIQAGLSIGLPTGAVTSQMHLAVMEVEAWFIGETTHFARIHPKLTVPFIVASGFDIVGQTADKWDHPAQILDSIYKLAKARYLSSRGAKTKRRIQRTIRALSFDELYITVGQHLPALGAFINSIEAALF